MNFDPVWLLLALPAAFGLGWLASRLDLHQLRTHNRSAPQAYFKGLNHLLNEQQDAAIDAFIEAVQKDPDTSELHFALGKLFRRRGEYERAIRVHEHLLARADISSDARDQAQHELAQDFLKAGLFNMAEDALRKLEKTSHAESAQLALLGIYERSREWQQALAAAQTLEGYGKGHDFSQRRAHFLCELAQQALQNKQPDEARTLLQQALEAAPHAARPRMQLAALEEAQGDLAAAWAVLEQALEHSPAAAPLMASTYARLAIATEQQDQARSRLQTLQQTSPSIDLVDALIALDAPTASAQALQDENGAGRYIAHLQHTPSLIAATRWLEHKQPLDDSKRDAIQRALQKATQPLARYRCAACGFAAQTHYWQCPGCHSWDSYPPRRVEEI
ncbi:MAG: lipopolysaccharide assembly protein LapB [Brachymonas sp.]|nr:lipopolysaccharide assembly protein LapB [Brachymonas sp.]